MDLDLEKLAIAVIKTAIADAIKNTEKLKSIPKRNRAEKDKQEAIQFLTGDTRDLEEWVKLAGYKVSTVKFQVKKVVTEPEYWEKALKRLKEYELHVN